jgi:hypothetical protein
MQGYRLTFWITALALAAGVLLRVQGMLSAYWFDEIWSTAHALNASSLAELYTRAHDNNHLLNTLAIYWIGPRDGWLLYRGLAFAAGLVLLATAVFERGRSGAERAVRALLLGASPLVVLLSTEARGYAPALAAALAAWALLQRRLKSGALAPLLGFNALLPLGMLSHLVFAHVYLASFAYAIAVLRARGVGARGVLRELTLLFGLPGALAVLHGLLFVRHMETGGGPEFGLGTFAARVVAFSYGVPEWTWLSVALAGIGVGVFGSHLAAARRAGDSRWVFDLVIVVASPILLVLLFAPSVIAVRYFALQVLFFLLAISDRLAAWLLRPGGARFAALGLLVAILLGNASHQLAFARTGRGQYLAALRAMAAAEPGTGEIRVAADHDSRARLLVDFYARFVDREFRFVRSDEIRELEPGWFLDHDVHRGNPPRERIGVLGRSYRLVGGYDFAYLSGFRWNLYRFESAESAEGSR